MAGFINYGNEIGRSELQLVYNIGKEQRHFKLGYEVLSTKLNYHEHWKKIVEDIEAEYRMLSLDYMKRTFHGFSPDTKGDTPELIWWSIFAGEQEKFIKACRSIIERPRRRLRGYEVYLRADKLKRVPTNIDLSRNHGYSPAPPAGQSFYGPTSPKIPLRKGLPAKG